MISTKGFLPGSLFSSWSTTNTFSFVVRLLISVVFLTGGVCSPWQCGEGTEAVLSANQQQDVPVDICAHSGGAQTVQDEGPRQRGLAHLCSSSDQDGVCHRVSDYNKLFLIQDNIPVLKLINNPYSFHQKLYYLCMSCSWFIAKYKLHLFS